MCPSQDVTVPSRHTHTVLPTAEGPCNVDTMVPSATPSPTPEPSAAHGALGMDVEVAGVAAIGDALLAAIPGPRVMPPGGDAQPSTGVDGRPSREAFERTVSLVGVPAKRLRGVALTRYVVVHAPSSVLVAR